MFNSGVFFKNRVYSWIRSHCSSGWKIDSFCPCVFIQRERPAPFYFFMNSDDYFFLFCCCHCSDTVKLVWFTTLLVVAEFSRCFIETDVKRHLPLRVFKSRAWEIVMLASVWVKQVPLYASLLNLVKRGRKVMILFSLPA